MSRVERVVLTNMCMVTDGSRVLVQRRNDPNWPGVVFPGGHVEPGESFVDSTVREVYEETGLTVSNLRLCGVRQWSLENGDYDRYIVFFFKTSTFTGSLRSSSEGDVFWIERADLLSYPLVKDFEAMLEVFESDSLNENYNWYDGGAWEYKNK